MLVLVLLALVAAAHGLTPSPTARPQSIACLAAGQSVQSGSGSVDFSTGYSNNLACSYTFTATAGSVARVTFFGTFYTETNYDHVDLFDATLGTSLGRLSGSYSPLPGLGHRWLLGGRRHRVGREICCQSWLRKAEAVPSPHAAHTLSSSQVSTSQSSLGSMVCMLSVQRWLHGGMAVAGKLCPFFCLCIGVFALA